MNTATEHTGNTIKILLRNNCPKLTARGKGELTYELGIDTTTEEHLVRIAENAQGGSFSLEWIGVQEIESLLENRGKDKDTFKANFFTKLYKGRSANNPGCLSAVLKAENVIAALPEQPTQLHFVSFTTINAKFKALKKEDVDLIDHVAIAKQEREDKKAKRKADKTEKKKVNPVTNPPPEKDKEPEVEAKPTEKKRRGRPRKKTKAKTVQDKKSAD